MCEIKCEFVFWIFNVPDDCLSSYISFMGSVFFVVLLNRWLAAVSEWAIELCKALVLASFGVRLGCGIITTKNTNITDNNNGQWQVQQKPLRVWSDNKRCKIEWLKQKYKKKLLLKIKGEKIKVDCVGG